MMLEQLDSHKQKNEPHFFSHTIYKINSKWIIDPNVIKAKTMEHLEENIGKDLSDFGFGKDFLTMIYKRT